MFILEKWVRVPGILFVYGMKSFKFYLTGIAKEDKRPIEEIVREKILQVLESAYPNVLEVEDLVRYSTWFEQI